jgi:hypothetical protein
MDAFMGALNWTVELAALLAEKQPRLKTVYLERYGADGPAGVMHPSLTIAHDGAVEALAWERDDFGDAAFAAALKGEILTWDMPDTTAGMTLGFDLEFDPNRGLYGVDVDK